MDDQIVTNGSDVAVDDGNVTPAASLSLPSRPAHSSLAKVVSQIRSLLRAHSATRIHQTVQQRVAITSKLTAMFTATSTHLQAQLDASLIAVIAFIHYAANIECSDAIKTLCRTVISTYTQLRRIDLFIQAHLDAVLLLPPTVSATAYDIITANTALTDAFAAQYSRQYVVLYDIYERFYHSHQVQLTSQHAQSWAEFFYAFLSAMTVREDIAATISHRVMDTLNKTTAKLVHAAIAAPETAILPAHTTFHLYYILHALHHRCAQYVPVTVDTTSKSTPSLTCFPPLADERMTSCFDSVGLNMTLNELRQVCSERFVVLTTKSMDTDSTEPTVVPFNQFSFQCALLRIGIMRLTSLHQHISTQKLINQNDSNEADDSSAMSEAMELCSLLTDHPLLTTIDNSHSLTDQSLFTLSSDCWPHWQNITEAGYRHYQLFTIFQHIQIIQIYTQTTFHQHMCSLILSAHTVSPSSPLSAMNVSSLCHRLVNDVSFYECRNIQAQFVPVFDETLQSLVTTMSQDPSSAVSVNNDSRKRKRTQPQPTLTTSWTQCTSAPTEALRQVLLGEWTDKTRTSSLINSSSTDVLIHIVNILRMISSLPDEYILPAHQFCLFVSLIHMTNWIDSEYRILQAKSSRVLLDWQDIVSSNDRSLESFESSVIYHASLSVRQATMLCLRRYHVETMSSLSDALGRETQRFQSLVCMALVTYEDATLREVNCELIKSLVHMALHANKHGQNDETFISELQIVISQLLSTKDYVVRNGYDYNSLLLIAAETMSILSTFDRDSSINEQMNESLVKHISHQHKEKNFTTITMTCLTALLRRKTQGRSVHQVVNNMVEPCMEAAQILVSQSSTSRADVLIALNLIQTVLHKMLTYLKGNAHNITKLTLSILQARSLYRRDHVITQMLNRILLQTHNASEDGLINTLFNQIRQETNSFIHAIDSDRVRTALYNSISALETLIHQQLPYSSVMVKTSQKTSAANTTHNKQDDASAGEEEEEDNDGDDDVVMNGESVIDQEKLYKRVFSHAHSEEITRIFAHIINVACIMPQYITHNNTHDNGAVDGRTLIAACIRCLTVIISSPALTLDSLDLTAALHALQPIITRVQVVAANITPEAALAQVRSDVSLLVALFDLVYTFYSALTLHRIARLMTHIATVQNQLHSVLKSIVRADANIKETDTNSLSAERSTNITEFQSLSAIPIRVYSDLSRLFVRLCTSQSYGANQTASDAHLRIRKYALSFISTYVSLISQYGLATNKRRLMDAAVYEYFNAINEYEMNQLYVTTTKVEQKDVIKALLKTYKQRVQYRGDK